MSRACFHLYSKIPLFFILLWHAEVSPITFLLCFWVGLCASNKPLILPLLSRSMCMCVSSRSRARRYVFSGRQVPISTYIDRRAGVRTNPGGLRQTTRFACIIIHIVSGIMVFQSCSEPIPSTLLADVGVNSHSRERETYRATDRETW